MTDKEIIRLLPTQPPREVVKAAMECPELHPSFITFKRVSVETGRIEWQKLTAAVRALVDKMQGALDA